MGQILLDLVSNHVVDHIRFVHALLDDLQFTVFDNILEQYLSASDALHVGFEQLQLYCYRPRLVLDGL